MVESKHGSGHQMYGLTLYKVVLHNFELSPMLLHLNITSLRLHIVSLKWLKCLYL